MEHITLREADQAHEMANMPGFRFHPTEEELVGYYLRRMVEGKHMAVELINLVDLYRYDPWELPGLAFMQGEREWLFFCPRDKKYPNGARPNRVTASGYWKATGTDRPVRSAQESCCIGLKKTLVFYTGRAPKGSKTEWIMNEYRLPQLDQPEAPPQVPKDYRKSERVQNEVALCRIYKKSISAATLENRANEDHLFPTKQTLESIQLRRRPTHQLFPSMDSLDLQTMVSESERPLKLTKRDSLEEIHQLSFESNRQFGTNIQTSLQWVHANQQISALLNARLRKEGGQQVGAQLAKMADQSGSASTTEDGSCDSEVSSLIQQCSSSLTKNNLILGNVHACTSPSTESRQPTTYAPRTISTRLQEEVHCLFVNSLAPRDVYPDVPTATMVATGHLNWPDQHMLGKEQVAVPTQNSELLEPCGIATLTYLDRLLKSSSWTPGLDYGENNI